MEEDLRRHGVVVAGGVSVQTISRAGSKLTVSGSPHFEASADVVLVAAGVRPNSELAAGAGVIISREGAICVDRQMATNLPDVYAAGDCAQTWHRVTGKYTYLPLGTTSHKQGRIAGQNAVGDHSLFAGSLGTQVVKVFDIAIARSGLRDEEARASGFDPHTVESKVWDHKAYYPGAQELTIRVTGDKETGKLLGGQIVGNWQAQVAKRIDIFATALFNEMQVEALNDLDLSYTPPLGSPWDAVQMAATVWARSMEAQRSISG